MPLITEIKESEALVADRRRPGRTDRVSPELIPIMRSAGTIPLPEDEELEFDAQDPDQLAETRGVLAGVVLSAPLWVGIAYVGHWLLS